MTQDEIIKMAKEAGYSPYQFTELSTLEIFIKLVAAHEREACAKLCDEARAARLAELIRARGQQ